MARYAVARVEFNAAAMAQLERALAGGVGELVEAIVTDANPPDRTPYGAGLVDQGGWLVFHDGRLVEAGSTGGETPNKPRAADVGQGIVGIAGFGFPGRFQEMGTVHHGAQPFLTPSRDQVAANARPILAKAVGRRGIG